MSSIRDRLLRARDQEYVTVLELALLLNVSERTIWRRLTQMDATRVLRSGRITRVHRVYALQFFRSPRSAVN